MLELDSTLTFDSFVVGPANRLASAAARRAAESPGTSYNPLFIYSASGLGKSHILTAIAHAARRAADDAEVLYLSLEAYLEELTEALQHGERDALKDRYRELDVLLLDDVQFLAGQPEAQEMLLTTLDALTASRSQIVLASDRPPAEIDQLDARLVSRFSGGLIVDIAPPEYETRVAIIRRKTEEREQELQEGVAEALARYPFKNVRELAGALNRILAVQELEGRPVPAAEVPGLMGEERPTSDDSDMDAFLEEISNALADTVEKKEPVWRREVRQAAEEAEQGGYAAQRMRTLLERPQEPPEWKERIDDFRADIQRLREIDEELDRLGNPWPEAAKGVLLDPDRLEEAEALLASVRERTRPFGCLPAGPELSELEGRVPALVLKAATQLVELEKPQFNPLYVWAEDPGVPKAVLAGAARTFRRLHPGSPIAVTSVADFADEFIRALSAGVAGAWRERWWTVDLLLVHGTEELSETERAQDEFFHLFEALKRRGARVLIVADRAPAGIEDIDDRLRSRFEGGLVLEAPEGTISEGEADLTLHEPAAEELVDEISAGEDTTAGPGPGSSGERGEGWVPTAEEVVWYWPTVRDRLVEDLE